jgi:DNA-binding NtrC family response regulator
LTQAHHKVLGFKSGDELMVAIDQEVPDLIFCDIRMPWKTGLETLAIRKNITEAHHGAIYVTSDVGVCTMVSIYRP